MSIVKIHKINKNKLKGDDERTFNEIVKNLIEDVEDYMIEYEVDDTVVSSIKLDDDVISKLSKYKLTTSESLENVIIRMMLISQVLNTHSN